MRSFEERRTEIFNRSDKRIAKRKKIYSAVTVCALSFVLVIAIVPTVIMRNSERECTNINDGATTGAITDISKNSEKNADNNSSHSDKIIILNTDGERLKDYYVDGAAAYIANLFADSDADNNKHDITTKGHDAFTEGDITTVNVGKVIIESFDGAYRYSLVGNFVISSDGKEVFLDENELSQLKSKLGIA